MSQRNNILQELSELGSTLGDTVRENPYTVPAGYFDSLLVNTLNRIKADEAKSAAEEVGYLSAKLSRVSRQMPFAVPAGYFERLAERILALLRDKTDFQSPKEELEMLSPLLGGLKKQTPYSVPAGYFDSLVKENKPAAKVISLTGRKWFRYAAAAVVTGVILLGGLKYFGSHNQFDPVEEPYAWVKKSIKKVDNKTIDAFVKLADEDLANQADLVTNPVKPNEIKELMKDVSDKELETFLNDTPETETSTVESSMN
ncbi:MAG: hypothetical protein ABIR30_08095 [Chitinophagaceae bacterium]